MTELIRWCSFCSSKPAVGIATLEDPDTQERVEAACCDECVDKLDWS